MANIYSKPHKKGLRASNKRLQTPFMQQTYYNYNKAQKKIQKI